MKPLEKCPACGAGIPADRETCSCHQVQSALAASNCSARSNSPTKDYLQALDLMMKAMDIIAPLPSRYAKSFRLTHDQFLAQLEAEAVLRESQEEWRRKYPMGRHH